MCLQFICRACKKDLTGERNGAYKPCRKPDRAGQLLPGEHPCNHLDRRLPLLDNSAGSQLCKQCQSAKVDLEKQDQQSALGQLDGVIHKEEPHYSGVNIGKLQQAESASDLRQGIQKARDFEAQRNALGNAEEEIGPDSWSPSSRLRDAQQQILLKAAFSAAIPAEELPPSVQGPNMTQAMQNAIKDHPAEYAAWNKASKAKAPYLVLLISASSDQESREVEQHLKMLEEQEVRLRPPEIMAWHDAKANWEAKWLAWHGHMGTRWCPYGTPPPAIAHLVAPDLEIPNRTAITHLPSYEPTNASLPKPSFSDNRQDYTHNDNQYSQLTQVPTCLTK